MSCEKVDEYFGKLGIIAMLIATFSHMKGTKHVLKTNSGTETILQRKLNPFLEAVNALVFL